jgi:hypothetical protein
MTTNRKSSSRPRAKKKSSARNQNVDAYSRPSATEGGAGGGFASILLVIIVLGILYHAWQPILLGISGYITMFFAWVALRSRADCDVKLVNGKYCSVNKKGILFGCGRHRTDKILAWLRYLGLGCIGRALHISIPILRWQDKAAVTSTRSLSEPTLPDSPELGQQAKVKSPKKFTLSPPVQGTVAFVGFLSSAVTVVAFILSLLKISSG